MIPRRNETLQLSEDEKAKITELEKKVGLNPGSFVKDMTDIKQPNYVIRSSLDLAKSYAELITKERNKK